jgi:hypothetical protein
MIAAYGIGASTPAEVYIKYKVRLWHPVAQTINPGLGNMAARPPVLMSYVDSSAITVATFLDNTGSTVYQGATSFVFVSNNVYRCLVPGTYFIHVRLQGTTITVGPSMTGSIAGAGSVPAFINSAGNDATFHTVLTLQRGETLTFGAPTAATLTGVTLRTFPWSTLLASA